MGWSFFLGFGKGFDVEGGGRRESHCSRVVVGMLDFEESALDEGRGSL